MSVPDQQTDGPGERSAPPDSANSDLGTGQRPGSAVSRRGFLRVVAGEAAQTAVAAGTGNVARVAAAAGLGDVVAAGGGTADATDGVRTKLKRDAETLARAAGVGFEDVIILDSGVAGEQRGGGAGVGAYRSPFRIEGDVLIVLDQRRFPGGVVEVPCLTAEDAAAAIRDGLAQGAGTVAAVGAYSLACAATDRARSFHGPRTAPEALAAIEADAATLLAAAPWVVSLRNGLAALTARARRTAAAGSSPTVIAEELRRAADDATMDELLELSRLVAGTVGLLREHAASRPDPEVPLRVLVHGPVGSLAFGQLGTAVAAIQGAVGVGIPVYAWLDEGRPGLSGVRNAWELSHAGVGYWLIPDSAVGGVLAAGSVDLVLAGALGVTRDGAIVDDPGVYAIGALAARHSVPVYVCAPRPVLFAEPAVSSPRFDVMPADLVAGFVTDAGILKPPFGPSLAAIAPPRPAGF